MEMNVNDLIKQLIDDAEGPTYCYILMKIITQFKHYHGEYPDSINAGDNKLFLQAIDTCVPYLDVKLEILGGE
jgi:hypothetical protein